MDSDSLRINPIDGGSSSTVGPGGGSAVPSPGVPASFPDDLDIHNIPPELKKEGLDWFAIFNAKVKRVLDVNLMHTLQHESVVCCVRFSADGKYLATGCNRTAQIYDTKTGLRTCILLHDSGHGDLYIRSMCFSPDGKYLATGAEDNRIRIWHIAKKRIRNVFDGHQQLIYSLDFSLDGRLIVSGSDDGTVRIWDMMDGTCKALTALTTIANDQDYNLGMTSVAISPNGRFVAASCLDTFVRIWDLVTATLVEQLGGHNDSVYGIAFTPDGNGLVSGSLDKTLKYWDVSGLMSPSTPKRRKEGAPNGGIVNGPGGAGRKDMDKASECTMTFTGHKDYVICVAVSHDGVWIVSGSKDNGVHFWDANNAIAQCMLQGHKNSVVSIDLSPAGNVLATGSGDWQARIWGYSTL